LLLAFVRILSKHRESVYLDHRIAQPRDAPLSQWPAGVKADRATHLQFGQQPGRRLAFLLAPFGAELRDAVAKCLDLHVPHHLPLKCFASVRIAAAIAFACWTSK